MNTCSITEQFVLSAVGLVLAKEELPVAKPARSRVGTQHAGSLILPEPGFLLCIPDMEE